MKNVKNLLTAALALLSAASMAVIQPGAPTSEDAPMRVSAGLEGSLLTNKQETGDKGGIGLNSASIGLGWAHNVGYDFEYGLAVSGGMAALSNNRLFTDDVGTGDKKMQGFGVNGELLFRFMPEIAESLRLGGFLTVGYCGIFGGDHIKKATENIGFGDMAVRLGPALSWKASDMISLYFTPAIALNHIRFPSDKVVGEPAKEAFKKEANLIGAEAPLGLMVNFTENVGMFVEANTKFIKFSDFKKEDWRENVALGVSFAM